MKKSTFFRLCYDKEFGKPRAKITDGFEDVFKDKDGNEITLCFHSTEYAKNKKSWSVTEKSTGLSVCGGFSTRKEAVERVIDMYIDRIFDKIQNDISYEKYCKIISDAYLGKNI